MFMIICIKSLSLIRMSLILNILVRCDLQNDDSLEKCDCLDFQKGGLYMKVEQIKDDNISSIRSMILSGEEGKDEHKYYLLVNEFVYYLSNVDDDLCIILLVPRHIKAYVVKQYHKQNGNMGVQKTFDSIRQKYFWPNCLRKSISMFQNVLFVRLCHYKKVRQPLQEADIPYPLAKLSLDLSGSYPTTLSGNRYIITIY